MSHKKSRIRQIFPALLFAGLILLSGYILKDSGVRQTVIFFLIAVWFSVQSYVNRQGCLTIQGTTPCS